MSKVKLKLELEIEGQKLKLSEEGARALHKALAEMFAEKEKHHHHQWWPTPWYRPAYWQYTTTTGNVGFYEDPGTLTCTDDVIGKRELKLAWSADK